MDGAQQQPSGSQQPQPSGSQQPQPSGSQQQQPGGSQQQQPSGSQQQPNVRSLEIEKSLEDVFHKFQKRREGLIKALTTDLERFLQECDPEKENLCLFGLPNGLWEVSPPVEEVPPTLPEPILGINFARELIDKEEDWLLLVAVHSDSWLISVAFFCGAYLEFDKNDRNRLFQMINGLPTVFEVFSRKHRKKLSTTQSNVNKTKLSEKMQQPQSSEPRPKRVKMSRPPIEDSESDDDDDEYEDEYEEEESFCGACGNKYVINEFWIFCDECETWFHGKCVKITPAMAKNIGLYKCPSCRTKRARVH